IAEKRKRARNKRPSLLRWDGETHRGQDSFVFLWSSWPKQHGLRGWMSFPLVCKGGLWTHSRAIRTRLTNDMSPSVVTSSSTRGRGGRGGASPFFREVWGLHLEV
ncbi:unnamed protein product, partial [Ectocarpus sp. 8 AP-2014]